MLKTFPIRINFYWYENRTESFDDGVFRYIKLYVIFLRGKGLIFSRFLFKKTTYDKFNLISELKKCLRNLRSTKIILENNVFILVDIWSTGPYHFYVDIMSKLIKLIEMDTFNSGNCKIMLFDDSFTDKVVVPLFRDLGLENLKIIKIKRIQEYLVLGRNYYITKPHIMGTNNPLVIPKVYDLIQRSLFKYAQNQDKYPGVYYYRTGRHRKVINDEVIIRELTRMGFYCTSFDEISYLEAYQIMQKTKLFIGIHGGGLTNMMFLPSGSVVVEIKNDNPNPESHCYWHLARSLNFDYTMFVAETVGDDRKVEGKGCDVRVDWNILNHFLDELKLEI